jgi:hypothetical protein
LDYLLGRRDGAKAIELRATVHGFRSAFFIELLSLVVAVMAFGRQSCINPALFPFRVVTDVGISHGRQFTGGVF